MQFKVIMISIALCQQLVRSLKVGGPSEFIETSTGVVKEAYIEMDGLNNGDFILNIQWYPSVIDTSVNFQNTPGIEIYRTITIRKADSNSSENEKNEKSNPSDLYFSLTPQIANRIDENYIPIPLPSDSNFKILLSGNFSFSIQATSGTSSEPSLNLDIITVLPKSKDRIVYNIANLSRFSPSEKLVLKVYFLKASAMRYEAVWFKDSNEQEEKLRRGDISVANVSHEFLLPIEIKKEAKNYLLTLIRPEEEQDDQRSDIVVKARLMKISNTSKVNLVALYQSLENSDYPLGVSIRYNMSEKQKIIDMTEQEYFLDVSGTRVYSIRNIMVYGKDADRISFRRLGGFDSSLLYPNLSQEQKGSLEYGIEFTERYEIGQSRIFDISTYEKIHDTRVEGYFLKKIMFKSNMEKHIIDISENTIKAVSEGKGVQRDMKNLLFVGASGLVILVIVLLCVCRRRVEAPVKKQKTGSSEDDEERVEIIDKGRSRKNRMTELKNI